MFEKYDIDRLYTCEIEVWAPWGIENIIDSMVNITGEVIREYQTIVYEDSSGYIDIYHLNRIICDMSAFFYYKDSRFVNIYHLNGIICDVSKSKFNHICCSDDGYLYVLDSYNLKKYSDGLSEKQKNAKTLQRLPFGGNRLLKK